ncbi:MAG: hypothetical protein ABII22_01530 [Candidatus Micrarchaeota archaeon]
MRLIKKTPSLSHTSKPGILGKISTCTALLANIIMLPQAEGAVTTQIKRIYHMAEAEVQKMHYSESEVANALEKSVPDIKERISPLPKKWWENEAKKYQDIISETTVDPDLIMDDDERRKLEIEMSQNANFQVMCRTLAGIVNAHEGVTPETLAESLRINEKAIDDFVEGRLEYYKGKRKITRQVVYHATIAAVMIGNIYGIDPLRILPTIDHESGYYPNATMIVKKERSESVYVGLYQIGIQLTPRHTYYKDPRYAKKYMFNRPIRKLGGYAMMNFPAEEGPGYEITNNTLYAVLSLVVRCHGGKGINWSHMYEGYAGIPGTLAAKRFAGYMDWHYRQFAKRFEFVLPKKQEMITSS